MALPQDLPFQWEPIPEDADQTRQFDLVRVPAAGNLEGIGLNRDLHGLYVHYVGGKTQPCLKKDCVGCQCGRPRKYEGYIGLWFPRKQLTLIYALTDNACRDLSPWIKQGKSLRGAALTLVRKGQAREGKLSARVCASVWDEDRLPGPPDVHGIMLNIWKLKQLSLNVNGSGPIGLPEDNPKKPRGSRQKRETIAIRDILEQGRLDQRGEVS